MCTRVFLTHASYEPLYWILFYASAGLIQVKGGQVMWTVNKILGVTALLIVIFFCVCTIPQMELEEHAKLNTEDRLSRSNPWFADRPAFSVLRALPLVSWLYIGIESTPLAGQAISEVNTLMLCIILLYTSY